MTAHPPLAAKNKIITAAISTFTAHGYDKLSMARIATAAGITRRALYHHFSGKEELFRACIRLGNVNSQERALAVVRDLLDAGAPPLDVVTGWFDARFGQTRRNINSSPHGTALNDLAFRIATDIMIAVSYDTNRATAEILAELLQDGRLHLRDGVTVERAARLLGDGARGVNQARPPIPNGELTQHYRDMVEAVLYGCAAAPAA